MSKGYSIGFALLIAWASLPGCDNPPVPKPRGYHRIEFPAFEYAAYAHPCGVSFEVPVYSKIERIEGSVPETGICWFNCALPRFSAKLHCTLMPVADEAQFASLVEDAHQMVFSHEMKAAGIRTQQFDFTERHVSGVMYNLQGPVASPIQFFATDSVAHFLRGSLYFDHTPNPDSLQPSLARIEKDIVHLIETLTWKETQVTP